ncbi:MAG: TraB/GumN family protein [Nanoarchaeota archaeon]|nr:TraB/GumN family protein [Nanoarchaeota archaeon]MBU1632874.1 TraB/GumN family protein [Nanoarchaeota archaeon]MBU1876680.1 TraB/GumN family protein [Nanoarchaeota archaeon]
MDIKIIGTSHIAKQSIDEIKKAIEEEKPEIIAVELDIQRASALLQQQKGKISFKEIIQIGIKGYLFAKIGQYIQQKLGKLVGVAPGSEMKTALQLAHKNKLEVALIDQPIDITLKNFSKKLTWKEKGRFILDIFKGIFFPKKQIKEIGLENFDLRTVPEKEIVSKMIKQIKTRYPNVYDTLIHDRNKYMVKKLIDITKNHPEKKIIAIVGAGHVEGMNRLLSKIDVVR